MAEKKNLTNAKNAKNDEFYTKFEDIQNEMNTYVEYDSNVFRGKTILLPCDDPEWSNFTRFFAQNFENFGLKKLISTSFANNSKKNKTMNHLSLLKSQSSYLNENQTNDKGKLFTLSKDENQSGRVDIDDLRWTYLEGDGDFRSEEVKALRDEADIIITNPPFSLFREFLAWIFEANKQFVIIGHQNAITYKEVFPLIKDNLLWLGKGFKGGAGHFINKHYSDYAVASNHIDGMIRVSGVVWFTNIQHGRRQQPLQLMTMDDNIKYSKHKEIKEFGYEKFDNYDAINVPYSDAIPIDYNGFMAVPITFLDKYCPNQFEIIDALNRYALLDKQKTNNYVQKIKSHTCNISGMATYFRIVIRLKK